MEKVCVIGLGYIGLPTASLMANRGLHVFGVDCISSVVDTVNAGKIHIVEPGLSDFVKRAVESGHLKAGVNPVQADVYILAVPTPFKEKHKPDLSYVKSSAKEIAPFIRAGNLVILESTSPVGTTEKVEQWIAEERPDLDITSVFFVHCPERVLPGKILEELPVNDRIIGGTTREATKKAVAFYRKFVDGNLLETDSRTAELSKLTENSFRDVNIAFANELSLICDKLDIDVWELISLANKHPRVNILQPGPGVGGHCIAVDPWFIVDSAPEEAKLIRMAREVNDSKPSFVLKKVHEAMKKFKNPTIACLGLAFKADIDDLRESPAIKIVEELADNAKANLLVVEPNIKELPAKLTKFSNIYFMNMAQAISEADIILLLVDHRAFKNLDMNNLVDKTIIDTRGIFR